MSNTTDATVEALTNKNKGAIDNGRLKKAPRKPVKKTEERNGQVAQSRPPVEPWHCDSCKARGKNFKDLQAHVEQTGHFSVTRD